MRSSPPTAGPILVWLGVGVGEQVLSTAVKLAAPPPREGTSDRITLELPLAGLAGQDVLLEISSPGACVGGATCGGLARTDVILDGLTLRP